MLRAWIRKRFADARVQASHEVQSVPARVRIFARWGSIRSD
jgi:hypothetical protein